MEPSAMTGALAGHVLPSEARGLGVPDPGIRNWIGVYAHL